MKFYKLLTIIAFATTAQLFYASYVDFPPAILYGYDETILPIINQIIIENPNIQEQLTQNFPQCILYDTPKRDESLNPVLNLALYHAQYTEDTDPKNTHRRLSDDQRATLTKILNDIDAKIPSQTNQPFIRDNIQSLYLIGKELLLETDEDNQKALLNRKAAGNNQPKDPQTKSSNEFPQTVKEQSFASNLMQAAVDYWMITVPSLIATIAGIVYYASHQEDDSNNSDDSIENTPEDHNEQDQEQNKEE